MKYLLLILALVGPADAFEIKAERPISLLANGANCSAGNYPLGVDASGAVESCTSATPTFAAFASSYTVIVAANGTNTTCAGAAVSTITFTTNGGNVKCELTGNVSSTGTNATIKLCVSIDNAWPTTEEGLVMSVSAAAGAYQNATALDLDDVAPALKVFKNISAGSHKYVLYVANSAGTWNVRTTSVVPSWGCYERGQ